MEIGIGIEIEIQIEFGKISNRIEYDKI